MLGLPTSFLGRQAILTNGAIPGPGCPTISSRQSCQAAEEPRSRRTIKKIWSQGSIKAQRLIRETGKTGTPSERRSSPRSDDQLKMPIKPEVSTSGL